MIHRFIDIFKLSDQGGSSDAKLLGKWFVTNVHHVFKKDKYQVIRNAVSKEVCDIVYRYLQISA